MALPYENATSGERAVADMQKLLQAFGCKSFGHMLNFDTGELLVQFKCQIGEAERDILVKASSKGYAAAWMKAHPYSSRSRITRAEYERKALSVGSVAVYSILRDWIKGQITAIQTGILTFEAAFLGQILLTNGRTVLEQVTSKNVLTAPE